MLALLGKWNMIMSFDVAAKSNCDKMFSVSHACVQFLLSVLWAGNRQIADCGSEMTTL